MLKTLRLVVYRDLLLALRRRSDIANSLLFFVIVVSLFPFGVGPEVNLLRAVGPGVLWVAALLASMLALSRMFAADYADGTLELDWSTPFPLVENASLVTVREELAVTHGVAGAPEVEPHPDTVKLVDERWREYFPR